MNDGVITCINVMRSAFQHQTLRSLYIWTTRICSRSWKEIRGRSWRVFRVFLRARTEVFSGFKGVQGQTRRTRNCQTAIRQQISDFNPPDWTNSFSKKKLRQTHAQKRSSTNVERKLQRVILEELRRECGEDESGWWMLEFRSRSG